MQSQTVSPERDVRLKRGSYKVDTTDWPLVVITAEGDISPAELERHLAEYRGVLDRNLPCVIVFDASSVGKIDAHTRRRYTEFMQQNNDDFRRLCRGIGFVITSSIVRGALTAVLWMIDFPFPYKIFATREEGTTWCRRQLWR